MLGREQNQNYRQGLRLGMGAFALGSRQQAHRYRSAAVAPNVQRLNARRALTHQTFLNMADPQMNPLAAWLLAQR